MTVSDEIIKVLDAVGAQFGIAIDWTQQNIIPYLTVLTEKIVRHEMATSITWILFCIVPVILFVKCERGRRTAVRNGENFFEGDYDISMRGLAWIASFVLSVIASVFIMIAILNIVTCITFPEKVVFDFIKSMAQGG